MSIHPVHPINVPLPLPTELAATRPRPRRSSTFTSITNWALAVQPGSPAPVSPHSRVRSNSSSFLHLVETPTRKRASSSAEKPLDLTSHGYTSVFVHLPYSDTPTTRGFPIPKSSNLKRIRSLGMLKRVRAKSNAAPPVPSIPLPPTPPVPSRTKTHAKSKSFSAANSKAKKTVPPLPPALASELMLMQFADGGSLETHARRVMESQARALAPAGRECKSNVQPLSAVYRDENGTMWWDEDEALEYKALLQNPPSPVAPWVQFDRSAVTDAERKGSLASVLTTSSVSNYGPDLSLSNIVSPANVEAYGGVAMQVLTGNPTTTTTTLTPGAQNKRTRRRPAPLKLRSADEVHNLNIFDDEFVPTIPTPPSPLSPTSSGSPTLLDSDRDVVMRNPTRDDRRDGMVFASPTNPVMIKKKASRMGLRVRAKALFSGRV